MYKFMAAISILIRQLYVPNPFESLGDGLIDITGEIQIMLFPEILNLVAEPFIYVVTFAVVGLYYGRGTAPAFGSLLYLVFYCIHIFLLWLMSLAGFAIWAVVSIIVLYVICHVLIISRINRCFL